MIALKDEETEEINNFINTFHKALKLYRNQEWDNAKSLFQITNEKENMFLGRKTNPSLIYLARCEQYKKTPPDKNWNGVTKLTKK